MSLPDELYLKILRRKREVTIHALSRDYDGIVKSVSKDFITVLDEYAKYQIDKSSIEAITEENDHEQD